MTSKQSHVVTVLLLIFYFNFQSTLSQLVETPSDCVHELSNGPNPHVDRPFVDTATTWTFVADTEFTQRGLLTTVNFFAKATNRPLEIGIYRPQVTGRQCEYKLIKKYRFDKSKIRTAGYIQLSIPNDILMMVQPGDHFGFTWLNKGVVPFSQTGIVTQRYCERNGSFLEGQTKSMNRYYGNRVYSLSVTYTNCSSNLVLPPDPVWDYNNEVIPPRLNDSEDNSYFQLQPEPTPQLKPRPLGMESCVIKQSYLSASSEQYGGEAYRARPLSCNSNQLPSGWQPDEEDSDPYLQIDLGTSVPVHGMGTLGHYNKTCWVEKYKVFVSNSSDEDSFVALKDKDTGMDRILSGNQDQNTWHHHCYHCYYGNPVMARYVRLVPLNQIICKALRLELYGFRNSDDSQLIDALQTDAWTKNTSGCQCYFDASRSDCACCEEGGCQCPHSNKHQCVQCGYSTNCGIPEQNDNNQIDKWTKSPTGCACPENPSDFSCACCQKYSCQCGALQPNQCVQCGHTEQHCGLKPEVFGPPPVCVPKSCP